MQPIEPRRLHRRSDVLPVRVEGRVTVLPFVPRSERVVLQGAMG